MQAEAAEETGDLETARAKVALALEVATRAQGAGDDFRLAHLLWELGFLAERTGAPRTAQGAWAWVLAYRERTLPDDDLHLQAVRGNLALSLKRTGDVLGACALEEKVLEICEKTLPDDHPALARALANLAVTKARLDDVSQARVLQERVLEIRERTLPEDNLHLALARRDLALTLKRLGDLRRARALEEKVLEVRERILPEDHPDLAWARFDLAVTMAKLGDLGGARALQKKVLATWEKTLPEGHPDLASARGNLALTLYKLGDLHRARALQENVLEIREKTLPEDDPDLASALWDLALTVREQGGLPRARALQEKVVAIYEKTLPADDPDLTWALWNLGVTAQMMEDLPCALALFERVYASWERTLPDDDPDLLRAGHNLAIAMVEMGDLFGARALQEEVLAIRETTLPDGDPLLRDARVNLAATMNRMDDLPGARALLEGVLGVCEKTLPKDHPELRLVRGNLASTMSKMGDLPDARALQEEVLAIAEKTLGDDHPDVQWARANLAVMISSMGDPQGARSLQEKVLATYETTLPDDHPDLQRARVNLCRTLAKLEEWEALRSQLLPLAASLEAWVEGGRVLSRRVARGRVDSIAGALSSLLSLSGIPGEEQELPTRVFELVETVRSVAAGEIGTSMEATLRPEVVELRERIRALNQRVNDLVAGLDAADAERHTKAEGVAAAVLERDRVEAELRRRLAEAGQHAPDIEVEALTKALPNGTAAVGYRVYNCVEYRAYKEREIGPEERHRRKSEPSLLAHVLRSDGILVRIELGPVEAIEDAVARWRSAVGTPVGKGTSLTESAPGSEHHAGNVLRVLVLDPVLRMAGKVDTLHVCLDGPLHLAPLDALPLGEGLVGDRYAIRTGVSFAQLLMPARDVLREASLLVIGGVDFDANVQAEPARVPSAAPPVTLMRGGKGQEPYRSLPGTQAEVEELEMLFEDRFAKEALLLTGEQATKRALFEYSPKARYLHLATHGYFADESVRSRADPSAAEEMWSPMRTEKVVMGMAPMTLCGLALAGANQGMDSLGRVPGIVTAEELAGLNLAGCDLAVLSACGTNVGISRAGQGIQSLQAALHAAGARTAITSLWKVPDDHTMELMIAFYANLWQCGMGKAEALWEAKRKMREQRYPASAWAGWVLTGDPD